MDEEILIPLGFFAVAGWIVYVIVDGYRRRQHLRMVTDFHAKLLERVGSAGEFSQFLNTDGGVRFLDSLSVERATSGAHTRILHATQSGLVLLALGLGLFAFLAVHFQDLPGRMPEGLLTFAAIVFSLGIGLLASAAAAWHLSKRMGLLKLDGTPDSGRPAA